MELRKAKRTQNASERQMETMINFMMKNEDLRSGKLTASFTKQDRKWKYKKMAKLLNADPKGAKKSTAQWIKCWNDKKGQARSKGAALNKELHTTGGGKNPIELTSMDETILGIVGIGSAVGNPDIDEGGFSGQSPSATSFSENERELQATPSAAREPQAKLSTSAAETPSLEDFTKSKKRAFRDWRKALPRTQAEDMRLDDQNVVFHQMHEELRKQTAAMSSIAASLEIIANKLI